MNISYQIDDRITPDEMMSLAEAVGWGRHRTLARNRIAIAGSRFIATARADRKLIGLLRLVGDGAYILQLADMMVHPSFQLRGVGRRLAELVPGLRPPNRDRHGKQHGRIHSLCRPWRRGILEKTAVCSLKRNGAGRYSRASRGGAIRGEGIFLRIATVASARPCSGSKRDRKVPSP